MEKTYLTSSSLWCFWDPENVLDGGHSITAEQLMEGINASVSVRAPFSNQERRDTKEHRSLESGSPRMELFISPFRH